MPSWIQESRRISAMLLPALILMSSTGSVVLAQSELADSAMNRDGNRMQSLLAEGSDPLAAQPDGMTALHWAAQYDDLEAVRLLLEHSAHPGMMTRYGISPLYFAALNGNARMLEAMLDAGGDPAWANPGGETLLMTAARSGDVESVRLLIDQGAAVNAREGVREQTALMWAVLEDHPPVVDLLLDRGADVNARTGVEIPDGMDQSITDRDGNRRLSADIGAHGPGVYRARAIPSPSGAMTPLLFAAREGNLPIARQLVAAGGDVNLPSANGTGPLVVATINNHIDLALYLLEEGADANASDPYHARTPLWAAVDMRNLIFSDETPRPKPNPNSPWDLIIALLDRGADPNARTNTPPIRGFMQQTASWVHFDGQTPFIRAAQSGDITLMRKLLDYGADPNIATDQGSTALMAAAGVNWVVGQTFTRPDEEYLEAVRLCLELGGDVNQINEQGFTAMHGATNRGFNEMVRLLAGSGARLDTPDSEGRTPMTFAEGVFLAVQPPVYKPETVAVLESLLARAGLPSGRSDAAVTAGPGN